MSKTGSAIASSGLLGFPHFTGDSTLYGTYEKGYMILKTSGILTLFPARTYDFFLVGGGASGASAAYSEDTEGGSDGGIGGGGGRCVTQNGIAIASLIQAAVTIGDGGVASLAAPGTVAGGQTILAIPGGATYTADGGSAGTAWWDGGYGGSGGGKGGDSGSATLKLGYAGGTNGSDGGRNVGSGLDVATGTHAFFDNAFDIFADGGSGGGSQGYWSYAPLGPNGGTGGSWNESGKHPPGAGVDNTGSGGGGAAGEAYHDNLGADGGSGVVIVRWGNWAV